MNAFLPIGIVFLAVGLALTASQGFDRGVVFVVLGFTFIVLALTHGDEDDDDDDDDETDDAAEPPH